MKPSVIQDINLSASSDESRIPFRFTRGDTHSLEQNSDTAYPEILVTPTRVIHHRYIAAFVYPHPRGYGHPVGEATRIGSAPRDVVITALILI
jgi:hypothetical protein